MVSLKLISSFASTARHASFAGAARELGLSPSAVAKNVARLETHLGVRLFHRTTRQVALTPDGTDFYDRCLRILDEISSLEAEAADSRSGVRGSLRIDVPVTYGRQVILPVLTGMVSRYPGLNIDVRFSDTQTDIIKEGLDAAIRIGPLADSDLVGRTFDEQVMWTCVSPKYLAEHGAPGTPEQLHGHNCLLFRLPTSGRERAWTYQTGRNRLSLTPASRILLGEGEAIVKAAVDGMGIAQVPGYMAEQDVKQGRLVEILRDYRPDPLPISLVYPSRRHVPLRVRALLDLLTEAGDGVTRN